MRGAGKDPYSRTDGGGTVAKGGVTDGAGKYGMAERGPGHGTSQSTRPPKTAPPTDLSNDGRQASFSDGYPHSASPSAKKPASAPSLAPVPRGYIHNEAAFQPTTRDTTGGRITRKKV